jgi:hypothetical protein
MTTIDDTQTGSTGPRTESGKAASSKNATKTGLFAAHDYLLEDEHETYEKELTELRTDLKPEGFLEKLFTQEIMSANWRLRRCRLVEAGISSRELTPEEMAAQQKSVDRARSHSHSMLRRSLAELRKLQTERAIRLELDNGHLPGLVDSKQLIQTVRDFDNHEGKQAKAAAKIIDDMIKAEEASAMKPPINSSFCNPTPTNAVLTPRNAACPCGSGEKYKRCCGKAAPPVLGRAA